MSSKQLFFNNDLMKACVAAVFAFGLAACSSSSSSDTPPVEPEPEVKPMPEPEPEPEPQALDIPAGGDLGGADNVGLGPISKDGDTSTLRLGAGASATRGDVTFTCPESATDGCTVIFTNEAGRVVVSELGGVQASIPTNPATPGVPPVTDRDAPDIAGTLTVTVTRGGESSDVAEFEIGHASYPDAIGPTTALTSLPTGWAGVSGLMTSGGSNDLDASLGSAFVDVIAASNIELATNRGFFDKYPNEGDSDDSYITILKKTDHSLLHAFTTIDTGDTADGNFDSVAGTYTCHSGPCSIVVFTDNPATPEVDPGSVVTGEIRFTPTTAVDAFNDLQDADYLTLGAWAHTVGGSVIETAAEYGASQPLTAAARSALARKGLTANETAEFAGYTVGAYYKESESGGTVDETSDLYTGTVTLTATFTPTGDTLAGSVTVTAAGDVPAGTFDLEAASLSADFAANGRAGTQQTGADAFDGTWAAQFVGNGSSIGGTYGVSRGSDADNDLERYDGAFGATELP
ncbi:MAG: hypothetical protein OXG71_03160 [Rhodospirillales bacterium]|nr:hypothetical protein [Rhodospirillales bacterium]